MQRVLAILITTLLFAAFPVFGAEQKDVEAMKAYFADYLDHARKDAEWLLGSIDRTDFGPLYGIGMYVSLYGVEEDSQRVEVFDVVQGLPAEKAGVRRGDTILSINGKTVSGLRAFFREIQGDNSASRSVF